MSLSVFTDFLFRLSGILFPIFSKTIVRYAHIKETLGHSSKDSTMRYVTTDKDVMRTLTLPCPIGGVMT